MLRRSVGMMTIRRVGVAAHMGPAAGLRWMQLPNVVVPLRAMAINRHKRPEPDEPEGVIDVEEEMAKWAETLKWNQDIPVEEFMLVNEDGKLSDEKISKENALLRAQKDGLELLLVTQLEPVVRLVNRQAYMEMKRGFFEIRRAKQFEKVHKLKEVRVSYNIGMHDAETKLNRVNQYLKKGFGVRLVVFMPHGDDAPFNASAVEEILKTFFPLIRGGVRSKVRPAPKQRELFVEYEPVTEERRGKLQWKSSAQRR